MRRIAVQIALSFVALSLLTVGIGVVAVSLLGDLGGAVGRTLDENVRSVVAAERMARALDAREAARTPADASAAAAAFAAALADARSAAVLPEEPALLDALDRAFAAGDGPETDRLRAELLRVNERAAAERAEQAAVAAREARRLLLFAVACALVASVVAGALLARRIARPLRDLTAGVAEVGRGHFRQRVGADDGGEVGALAAAFNEMAGRLEAYEALNLRALLRETRTAASLVAAIPSPVVVTEGGRVRLANAAAAPFFDGGDPEGRPLAEAAPALAAAAAAEGEPLVDLPADGRTFRLRQSRVDAEGDPLAVLLLDDVTPFRALDAARRDFLAAVSHELRTPLTSMHVAADLLLRDVAGPLTDDQRELAAIVKGDAERMKALTARLLDLARVEVGGRPTGPVDLGPLAAAAAEGVRLVAAERGVVLAVEAPEGLVVEGDPDGLAMAVSNLVANAVRHAAARVTVRAEPAAGGVRVAVEDDGPGVPAGAEARVFEPLVQLAPDGEAPSGAAGLGLAIVRRVAEAHGGRAWAEAGPGGRFFMSLPAAGPA